MSDSTQKSNFKNDETGTRKEEIAAMIKHLEEMHSDVSEMIIDLGRVFAGIVSDETLPDELRAHGFLALAELDGDCVSSSFFGIENLSSLDWNLVRAYSH